MKPKHAKRKHAPEAAPMQDGLFVWGRRPVEMALSRDELTPRMLYFKSSISMDDPVVLAGRRRGIAIHKVDVKELDRRAPGINHQGFLAEFASLPASTPTKDLLADKESALIIALDGVTDSGNLGAVFRVAMFFGADAVVFPSRRSAGITGAVVKAGAGAPLILPHGEVTNLVEFLREAQNSGYWVYGAEAHGGKLPWELDITGKRVLVLGSESDGMRRLVRETCDELITIPGGENFESLNVSAAAAALCAEFKRQDLIRGSQA